MQCELGSIRSVRVQVALSGVTSRTSLPASVNECRTFNVPVLEPECQGLPLRQGMTRMNAVTGIKPASACLRLCQCTQAACGSATQRQASGQFSVQPDSEAGTTTTSSSSNTLPVVCSLAAGTCCIRKNPRCPRQELAQSAAWVTLCLLHKSAYPCKS